MAPQDPNGPKGPGTTPNVDPGLADVFRSMADALEVAGEGAKTTEEYLAKIKEHFQTTAESTKKVKENVGDSAKYIKDLVKFTDDLDDNYKTIHGWANKIKSGKIEDYKAQKKANEQLDRLVGMYKDLLKYSKANTAETKAIESELKKVENLQHKIQHETQLSTEHMDEFVARIQTATKDVRHLVRGMQELGTMSANLKGLSGMLGAVGIGKGLSYKIERRMEQVQELKE